MSRSEHNSASVSIRLDPDDVAASRSSRVATVHRPSKQLLDSRDIPGPQPPSLGGNVQQVYMLCFIEVPVYSYSIQQMCAEHLLYCCFAYIGYFLVLLHIPEHGIKAHLSFAFFVKAIVWTKTRQSCSDLNARLAKPFIACSMCIGCS